ncbi:MAG: SGNH/GDSL hydrolase family protein [Spirochaetes bacterium]|jgi:lysophospholipase L1-like esterase|nr:SGNH/GDSL hydrolase family protein [Spirochaetota bacterium]
MLKRTISMLEKGDTVKIVALGDSLTQGWMARKGYIDFVSEMITARYGNRALNMVNRGIPGDTSEGGLHRLGPDVLDEDPDLVFIQFALNDAYTGYPAERFKGNIGMMVDSIRSDTRAEILLITSVPIFFSERESALVDSFYSKLEEISEGEGVPLARVHEYWRKRAGEGINWKDLVQDDLVHPTVEGYRLMAEAVFEHLKSQINRKDLSR